MLAILSPAKTLDYQTPLTTKKSSQADFNRESSELMSTLRKFAPADIASLMKIVYLMSPSYDFILFPD